MKTGLPKGFISMPIYSGKCRQCHSEQMISQKQLCHKCNAYVVQDHVGRDESLMHGRMLEEKQIKAMQSSVTAEGEDLSGNLLLQDCCPLTTPEAVKQEEVPCFEQMLELAKLSKQQRQIVSFYFIDGWSFLRIAKNLNISRQCVHIQYQRAVEKLRVCLTASGVVKDGERKKPLPEVKTKTVNITRGTSAVSRKQPRLLKQCPRCKDKIFCVDHDFQYCMNCLWNSDTEEALYGKDSLKDRIT